ncbi:MAG: DUF2232 domain-containing protein [Candidatus Tectomicrobia bacterium]
MKAVALKLLSMPWGWEALCLIILSLVLTLMTAMAPVEGLFLTILTPFPLLVLAVKYPWPYALWLAGLEAGGVLSIGGFQALILFSQYGLVPLVMAWAIRQNYVITRTLIWSIGVPLLAGSTLFIFYSVFANQAPHLLFTSHLEQVVEIFQEEFQTLEQPQGMDSKRFEVFIKTFSQFILTIFPALLVINHLLTNVLNYALVRYYCNRSRPPIVLDPPDLARWRISDYIVWIFLASGIALLLPVAPISVVGLNVFLVTLVIYFLQGLAIAGFGDGAYRFPLACACCWR